MAVLAIASGCNSKYVTPGAGVNLQSIDDYSIEKRFATKPAANFPARLAVARIQQPGYYSYGNRGYGEGNYSIVTTRDVEKDEHFAKLEKLPQVAGLATLGRLLLPPKLETVKDLRLGAASLHADMLLLYTLDTSFRVKDHDIGPLGKITLGLLPNKKAYVTTTASAVIYDVRTGHVYGQAEATHKSDHIASSWTQEKVVDNARLDTEQQAFAKLIENICQLWPDILKEYANKKAGE
jgi:hypothetical protein